MRPAMQAGRTTRKRSRAMELFVLWRVTALSRRATPAFRRAIERLVFFDLFVPFVVTSTWRRYSQRNTREAIAVNSANIRTSTAASPAWAAQPSPCQIPRSSDTA